jgi:hypothetical protein
MLLCFLTQGIACRLDAHHRERRTRYFPDDFSLLSSGAPRLRTHNQNMTVAARAIAERKTVGDLS